jgi:hypothetical protein
MTTAHRPTWAPAKGHEEQGGARMFGPSRKHSKLDDNAHMTLKTRAVGQMSVKELVARDFKAELLAKEAKHFKRKLPASAGGHLMPSATATNLAARGKERRSPRPRDRCRRRGPERFRPGLRAQTRGRGRLGR